MTPPIKTALAAVAAFAALLVVLLGQSGADAANAVVAAGSAEARPGQQLSIDLEARDLPDPGLGAYSVDVTYDSEVLSPVSCSTADAGALCNTEFGPGTVRCGGFSASGLSGEAILCSLAFEAVGGDGQCSDIKLAVVEFVDVTTAPLPHSATDGFACVSASAEPPPATEPGSSGPGPGTANGADGPDGAGSPDGDGGEASDSSSSAGAASGDPDVASDQGTDDSSSASDGAAVAGETDGPDLDGSQPAAGSESDGASGIGLVLAVALAAAALVAVGGAGGWLYRRRAKAARRGGPDGS